MLRIQKPTLLVYGRNSHFISSYEYLHKALPNCKSVLLPGGEHFGPLEQPELLTEHVQKFLCAPCVSRTHAVQTHWRSAVQHYYSPSATLCGLCTGSYFGRGCDGRQAVAWPQPLQVVIRDQRQALVSRRSKLMR